MNQHMSLVSILFLFDWITSTWLDNGWIGYMPHTLLDIGLMLLNLNELALAFSAYHFYLIGPHQHDYIMSELVIYPTSILQWADPKYGFFLHLEEYQKYRNKIQSMTYVLVLAKIVAIYIFLIEVS